MCMIKSKTCTTTFCTVRLHVWDSEKCATSESVECHVFLVTRGPNVRTEALRTTKRLQEPDTKPTDPTVDPQKYYPDGVSGVSSSP